MDNEPVDNKTLIIYICSICGNKFGNRDSLRAHCKRMHKLNLELPKTIICPLCNDAVRDSNDLDKHMSLVHNISLEHKKLIFKTEKDFKVWKSNIEKETKSYYKARSTKIIKKKKITYYHCNRSGVYTPTCRKRSVKPRSMKSAGSVKMGSNCPARIRAIRNKKGYVEIDYVSQHVGHECEVKRLRLTPSERESLAAKLMSGIPHQQILEDLSKTFDANTRISFITNHDLHNIKSAFNVNANVNNNKNIETASNIDANVNSIETDSHVNANARLQQDVTNSVDRFIEKYERVLEVLYKTKRLTELTGSSNNLEDLTRASEVLSSTISGVQAREGLNCDSSMTPPNQPQTFNIKISPQRRLILLVQKSKQTHEKEEE